MAIGFPRALPAELKALALSFTLHPTGAASPVRGGKQIWLETGPALWHAWLESTNLSQREFGIAQAWYDTLLSEREFLGYDKHRQYPIAHAGGWGSLTLGGNPFDGTGKLDTGTAGFQVNLKALANGLTLTPGDFLAFDYAASRALHRVVAGDVSIGNLLSVEVRPAVRVGWAVNDVVLFYRPAARMLILPETYSAVQAVDGSGRISFDAVQSL